MTRSINPLTLNEYKALVAGIPTYCPNAIFTVAGQTFTATQAVTFIQAVLNAVASTATAKGAWKDAIAAEEKLVAQDGTTVKEIRNNIASMFSNALNTLTAFEIAPRKPYVPLTAAKRAAATAKAAATRLARGTTSKKQKATVVGNVTGVVITPTTGSTPSAAVPTAGGGTAAPAVGAVATPVASGGAVLSAAPAPAPAAPASPQPAAPEPLPVGTVTAK
jgi:hypothetical protein